MLGGWAGRLVGLAPSHTTERQPPRPLGSHPSTAPAALVVVASPSSLRLPTHPCCTDRRALRAGASQWWMPCMAWCSASACSACPAPTAPTRQAPLAPRLAALALRPARGPPPAWAPCLPAAPARARRRLRPPAVSFGRLCLPACAASSPRLWHCITGPKRRCGRPKCSKWTSNTLPPRTAPRRQLPPPPPAPPRCPAPRPPAPTPRRSRLPPARPAAA